MQLHAQEPLDVQTIVPAGGGLENKLEGFFLFDA
jgi:hypothetical protein